MSIEKVEGSTELRSQGSQRIVLVEVVEEAGLGVGGLVGVKKRKFEHKRLCEKGRCLQILEVKDFQAMAVLGCDSGSGRLRRRNEKFICNKEIQNKALNGISVWMWKSPRIPAALKLEGKTIIQMPKFLYNDGL